MERQLETIIGLEIHVQAKTDSKMFCRCVNGFDWLRPNSTICPICAGHPGTLPVVNKKAFEKALTLARALNCDISKETWFERKNYFYPDLPKGYQISQYEAPIGRNGEFVIEIGDQEKRIGIERVHIEEDTGKLLHLKGKTLIDFNRAGIPLIEIVTKPELRSPLEAKIFLQEFKLLVQALKISDAEMEKGQFRCDANISLKRFAENTLHPKTEIKNLNSFKFVETALLFEQKLQEKLWNEGKAKSEQETKGYDEKTGETILQRQKETENDYRYFPEPDIPPLHVSEAKIQEISSLIPELPYEKRKRFQRQYFFSKPDAYHLTLRADRSEFTERVLSELKEWLNELFDEPEQPMAQDSEKRISKMAANWILSDLTELMNARNVSLISQLKVTPENFAELLAMILRRKISSSAGRKILKLMIETGRDPSVILEEEDLEQISDQGSIEEMVNEIMRSHEDIVKEIQRGKDRKLQFLVGLVMKQTKGKGDPEMITHLFQSKIKKL